jgi:hypothetical protein
MVWLETESPELHADTEQVIEELHRRMNELGQIHWLQQEQRQQMQLAS